MADIYSRIGSYDEALGLYQKSLQEVPVKEMADIQLKIAEMKQAQGKLNEAIEEYLKVTYLYSENSQLSVKALLRVAAIYEDKENFPEALKIYKRVISMNTQEAKYAQERADWIKAHTKQ
jgi:tetratricopeptide (TPR) repeat protein